MSTLRLFAARTVLRRSTLALPMQRTSIKYTRFSTEPINKETAKAMGLSSDEIDEKFMEEAPEWDAAAADHDEAYGKVLDSAGIEADSDDDPEDTPDSDETKNNQDFDFYDRSNWWANNHDRGGLTKKKHLHDKFPPKWKKVSVVTELAESTMGEEGDLETAYIMGQRLYERQHKPMVVEITEDVSELDPYRGTRFSLYQRDKAKLKKQMSHMRVYYRKQYEEGQRRKQARIQREYDVLQKLKTEKLTQQRIKAYFNEQAHLERADQLRTEGKNKRAYKRQKLEIHQQKTANERLYQIEFLRQERDYHWIKAPSDITEDMFDDSSMVIPVGSLVTGGSGMQTNFRTNYGNFKWPGQN